MKRKNDNIEVMPNKKVRSRYCPLYKTLRDTLEQTREGEIALDAGLQSIGNILNQAFTEQRNRLRALLNLILSTLSNLQSTEGNQEFIGQLLGMIKRYGFDCEKRAVDELKPFQELGIYKIIEIRIIANEYMKNNCSVSLDKVESLLGGQLLEEVDPDFFNDIGENFKNTSTWYQLRLVALTKRLKNKGYKESNYSELDKVTTITWSPYKNFHDQLFLERIMWDIEKAPMRVDEALPFIKQIFKEWSSNQVTIHRHILAGFKFVLQTLSNMQVKSENDASISKILATIAEFAFYCNYKADSPLLERFAAYRIIKLRSMSHSIIILSRYAPAHLSPMLDRFLEVQPEQGKGGLIKSIDPSFLLEFIDFIEAHHLQNKKMLNRALDIIIELIPYMQNTDDNDKGRMKDFIVKISQHFINCTKSKLMIIIRHLKLELSIGQSTAGQIVQAPIVTTQLKQQSVVKSVRNYDLQGHISAMQLVYEGIEGSAPIELILSMVDGLLKEAIAMEIHKVTKYFIKVLEELEVIYVKSINHREVVKQVLEQIKKYVFYSMLIQGRELPDGDEEVTGDRLEFYALKEYKQIILRSYIISYMRSSRVSFEHLKLIMERYFPGQESLESIDPSVFQGLDEWVAHKQQMGSTCYISIAAAFKRAFRNLGYTGAASEPAQEAYMLGDMQDRALLLDRIMLDINPEKFSTLKYILDNAPLYPRSAYASQYSCLKRIVASLGQMRTAGKEERIIRETLKMMIDYGFELYSFSNRIYKHGPNLYSPLRDLSEFQLLEWHWRVRTTFVEGYATQPSGIISSIKGLHELLEQEGDPTGLVIPATEHLVLSLDAFVRSQYPKDDPDSVASYKQTILIIGTFTIYIHNLNDFSKQTLGGLLQYCEPGNHPELANTVSYINSRLNNYLGTSANFNDPPPASISHHTYSDITYKQSRGYML